MWISLSSSYVCVCMYILRIGFSTNYSIMTLVETWSTFPWSSLCVFDRNSRCKSLEVGACAFGAHVSKLYSKALLRPSNHAASDSSTCHLAIWNHFNIKISFYRYRNSHYKDNISRFSYLCKSEHLWLERRSRYCKWSNAPSLPQSDAHILNRWTHETWITRRLMKSSGSK